VKERKPKRADDTADESCSYRGAEQSKDTTQLIELKWGAKESLDEPCDNEGATSIGHSKKCSAGDITIAEQIGCEGGRDYADDNRPPHGRTERHHETGSYASCRPEHRDTVRLVEQSEAETRCEKKSYRNCD